MSNIWRSVDLPSIDCEIDLDLTWSKYCVISEVSRKIREVDPNSDQLTYEVSKATTESKFQISIVKLYVPVVTLSINDNIKFLENINQEFKRTVSWNKYRCETTKKINNNNLDHLIDKRLRNINRLFALSCKNGDYDPIKNPFDEHYMTLVEIKDFNALTDNKTFFDQPVKTKKKRIKSLLKCQQMMTTKIKIY